MTSCFHIVTEPTCGLCRHYRPFRDQETKRVHPRKLGECGWQMPEFKWPMAYRRNAWFAGSGHEHDPVLHPVKVQSWTQAETCACFEKI